MGDILPHWEAYQVFKNPVVVILGESGGFCQVLNVEFCCQVNLYIVEAVLDNINVLHGTIAFI